MYEYPLSERPLVEISYRSCSGIGRTEGVLLSMDFDLDFNEAMFTIKIPGTSIIEMLYVDEVMELHIFDEKAN